jgi:nickel/cobalt exporter
MTFFRITAAFTAVALAAMAHPMGNFSVNHYSRLHLRSTGLELTYVLDLAEIPTFQLLRSWKTDSIDKQSLDRETRRQAEDWISNLALLQNGERIPWQINSVTPRAVDGAGGMPTLRIAIIASAGLHAGEVSYEDLNFPGRAGWKEIVIDHADGALVQAASHGAGDLSAALTHYPTDPSIAPPQDLTARLKWAPAAAPAPMLVSSPRERIVSRAAIQPVPKSESLPATLAAPPAPTFVQQQPTAPGTVVRGDFLSRMLQRRDLGWGLIALCILAAFGLGATHALSPGHGKTIVAAYLVGSRGTLKHAGLLGFVVTFTHTFTVFMLGLGVLFFQQYVVPEKIVPALGAVSGLSIVLVGAWLLYQRAKALVETGQPHHHQVPIEVPAPALALAFAGAGGHDRPSHHHHNHEHQHDHVHTHAEHANHHDHSHNHGAIHSHGGRPHSHMIQGDITARALIALGISGGLVPCPSALILMLSAIALGRPALGLVLLIGFSAGLALVLMTIGALALYARHLLPDSKKTAQNPVFRLIPVFSAVVVICLGMAITAISAGWVRPMLFLS